MATQTRPPSAQAGGREDRRLRAASHVRPTPPAGLTRHCPGPTWHGWPLKISSSTYMMPSVKDVAFYLHTCGPAADAFRFVTVADLCRELGYAKRPVQAALERLQIDQWIAPGRYGAGKGYAGVTLWWLRWKLPEEECADDGAYEGPISEDDDDSDGPFTLATEGGAP